MRNMKTPEEIILGAPVFRDSLSKRFAERDKTPGSCAWGFCSVENWRRFIPSREAW